MMFARVGHMHVEPPPFFGHGRAVLIVCRLGQMNYEHSDALSALSALTHVHSPEH